ncbi:MAG: 23S rRNA (pseudouridine(1915)-N(3))-methyltransferase RlmH [Oscillospiraceae bacterium]
MELPESRLPESPPRRRYSGRWRRRRWPSGKAPRRGNHCSVHRGKPCSSVELSRRMEELAVAGKTQLTFLIGGSVGLDESLKRQADWRLSMSP